MDLSKLHTYKDETGATMETVEIVEREDGTVSAVAHFLEDGVPVGRIEHIYDPEKSEVNWAKFGLGKLSNQGVISRYMRWAFPIIKGEGVKYCVAQGFGPTATLALKHGAVAEDDNWYRVTLSKWKPPKAEGKWAEANPSPAAVAHELWRKSQEAEGSVKGE